MFRWCSVAIVGYCGPMLVTIVWLGKTLNKRVLSKRGYVGSDGAGSAHLFCILLPGLPDSNDNKNLGREITAIGRWEITSFPCTLSEYKCQDLIIYYHSNKKTHQYYWWWQYGCKGLQLFYLVSSWELIGETRTVSVTLIGCTLVGVPSKKTLHSSFSFSWETWLINYSCLHNWSMGVGGRKSTCYWYCCFVVDNATLWRMARGGGANLAAR